MPAELLVELFELLFDIEFIAEPGVWAVEFADVLLFDEQADKLIITPQHKIKATNFFIEYLHRNCLENYFSSLNLESKSLRDAA